VSAAFRQHGGPSGGASGVVFGTLFQSARRALTNETFDAGAFATALEGGLKAVRDRGGAKVGDKTMVDALAPPWRQLAARSMKAHRWHRPARPRRAARTHRRGSSQRLASQKGRYEEFLAPEFTASLPDYNLHDRKTFLDIISKPRPFKDLECYDVQITLVGDVALVHARMTLKTLSGVVKHGRYIEEYLRRDGKWWCIGANVISENITA
jgi:hypothetical protein